MSEAKRNKRARTRHLLRRILSIAGIFLLILLLLVVAAFYSETVFRQVAKLARPVVPDELQYETVSGTLAGPVAFTSVTYRIAGTEISADHLSFDITPLSLLANRVNLQDVAARKLTVVLPKSEEAESEQAPTDLRGIIETLRLPVAITADSIRVDGFVLLDAARETVFEMDRFRASLDWSDERIAISALETTGPFLDANGDVALGLVQGAQSNALIDLAWHAGEFPISVHVNAEGTTELLNVRVRADAPARATLHVLLHDLLDTPRWKGTLVVDALAPSRLRDDLPNEPWSGTFEFDGGLQDTNVRGSARGAWPPAKGIALSLRADVNAERVALRALEGRVATYGAQFTARGELHYADALRYAAQGEIDALSLPDIEGQLFRVARFNVRGNDATIEGEVQATADGTASGQLAVNGRLQYSDMHFDADVQAHDFRISADGTNIGIDTLDAHATGIPQAYRATVNARAQVNTLPTASTALELEGDLEKMTVLLKELRWLNGTAEGTAGIQWQEGFSVNAALRGEGFELAALDTQLAGVLGGNFLAHADFSAEQPRVGVQIRSLTGNIAGAELQGSGSVRLEDARIRTQGLNISAGASRLELEDSTGAGFDFTLEAPDLRQLHPDIAGAIAARGHFEGALVAPTLRIDATGNKLQWQDWTAEQFELDIDLRDGGEQPSSARLTANGLATPALDMRAARLELDGSLASHRIALSTAGAGTGRSGELDLAATGGFADDAWRGEITKLQLAHPLTGDWKMRAGAEREIVLAADAINVPAVCLDGDQGHACLGPFRKDDETWLAAARLDAIPVSAIAGWLPEGLEYRGTVDGRFRIAGNARGLDGHAEFNLAAGAIRQGGDDDGETLLGWESGRAVVDFDGGVARAELNVELEHDGRIIGSGTLDVPENGPMCIDAGLRANIENLQLVPSLVPELSRVRGRLSANLDVEGPLDDPRVTGTARLADGSARILALGTNWQNVNLLLEGEGRQISARGRAESGDGHVEVNLEGIDTANGFTGRATLAGTAFQAISTPEARVNISPKLQMQFQGRDIFIDGEVLVPFARIEPRDLGTAVQPSDDEVIVNAEHKAAAEGVRVHVAVTTRLGEDVRVDAFGLAARLEGKLTVTKAPQQVAVGNGRLTVMEGEYKAYGQDLTLARGDIIYAGQPLNNPGLDVRAERSIDPDIIAGVALRGPLSQPTVSVYSEPAMPETEALSYLLFGRSVDQITGAQESEVSNASLALNLGGQKLLGRFGRKIGVEEVRIDQVSDKENASLILGKYLSPDLYVSYGIGLYEAVNTFQVRYRLSSKWTLEATSGLKSSADVFYTIER